MVPDLSRENTLEALNARTIVNVIQRVVRQTLRDDVPGLAAELAYRSFLALFPFLLFLVALGGFVAYYLGIENPASEVAEVSQERLPPSAADLVTEELWTQIGTRNPELLSTGIVGALVVAASGVKAFMKASNRAYDLDESRSWWRRYLLALGLTLLAGGAIMLALMLFLTGQIVGSQVARTLGIEPTFWRVYQLARWPITVLLVFGAAVVLYRFAPSFTLPLRWVLPGAILFVGGWLSGTYLFGYYVSNFASYGFTYGTTGGVVVLLIWFYMTAFILLVGLELNEVIHSQFGSGTIAERSQSDST
ncbi:MAG: YihY/virulence factor BrkB family protein [Chloroflexota bacterium]